VDSVKQISIAPRTSNVSACGSWGVCSASLVLPTGVRGVGKWGKEWGTSQLTSLFLQIISVGYIAIWK
jgi:hypothetical protein